MVGILCLRGIPFPRVLCTLSVVRGLVLRHCAIHHHQGMSHLVDVSATRRRHWQAPSSEHARAPRALPPRSAAYTSADVELVTVEEAFDSEQLTKAALPVWRTSESLEAVIFSTSTSMAEKTSSTRNDVPGVPGAFVLRNVCTAAECDALIALTEAMGYTPDAPTSMGKRVRENGNVIYLIGQTVERLLYRRIAAHLPIEACTGIPCGLNRRLRLYKYAAGQYFGLHRDGAWPGSGLDDCGRYVQDMYGDRMSQLTVLLYLNDDYEGGATGFFVPDTYDPRDIEYDLRSPAAARSDGEMCNVRVGRGDALLFFHGDHRLSLLHEGCVVTGGVKYIVRTDVLYTVCSRIGSRWRIVGLARRADLNGRVVRILPPVDDPDHSEQDHAASKRIAVECEGTWERIRILPHNLEPAESWRV